MEPKQKELIEYGDDRGAIKVLHCRPPNFDQINAVFPGASGENIIFAYGDAIYNPSGKQLPEELIAHEEAHCKRQQEMGVDAWWDKYLVDGEFRYDEEYIAHLAELKCLVSKPDTNARYRKAALEHVARKLCAPLYQTKISMQQAESRLRRGLKNA